MIRSWFKRVSEKRFKLVRNYRLDRWLFQAGMFMIFAWLFFIVWSANFQLDYFYCPENADGSISGSMIMLSGYELEGAVVDGACRNPFYKNDWKNQEYLASGEYGTKPGPFFRSAFASPFIVFGFILLINHFWHNRKFEVYGED